MSRDKAQRSRTFELTVATVIIVGLTATAFIVLRKETVSVILPTSPPPPPPLTLSQPIKTIAFADGSALEIFQLGEAELQMGTLTAPPAFFGEVSAQDTGRGSTNFGLDLETAEFDGNFSGIKWSSPPANLLVACRFLDSAGMSQIPKSHFWNGQQVTNRGRHRDSKPTWEEMISGSPSDKDLPPLMVQISDGQDRWITASGPTGSGDNALDLCALLFGTWPRSPETLTFRAVRPGQASVTWTLPNPKYPVTPAAWTPDSLPKTVSGPEFDLTFQGMHQVDRFEGLLAVDYRFNTTVLGDAERSPYFQSLQAQCVELQGALGTRTPRRTFVGEGGEIIHGFETTPDESLFRFRFEVRPSPVYPYHRRDAVELVSAIVSKDGKSMKPASNSLHSYGLQSVGVLPVEGESGWDWSLKFEWRSAKDAQRAKHDLLLDGGIPVCFLDDAARSTGSAMVWDLSASSSGEGSDESFTIRWDGIPAIVRAENSSEETADADYETPKPGTRVTLGLVTPHPTEGFFFVTSRAD
jgi:hypothetical protein